MTHARTISPTGTPCPLCGGQVWTNGAVTMCGDCFQMPQPILPGPVPKPDAGQLAGGARVPSRSAGLFHNHSAPAGRADAAPGRVAHSLQGPTEARHSHHGETDAVNGRGTSPTTEAPPTKGNIRAAIAFAIFAGVAVHLPEIIAWIGGAL